MSYTSRLVRDCYEHPWNLGRGNAFDPWPLTGLQLGVSDVVHPLHVGSPQEALSDVWSSILGVLKHLTADQEDGQCLEKPGLSDADHWLLQGGWIGWIGWRLKIFEWQIC